MKFLFPVKTITFAIILTSALNSGCKSKVNIEEVLQEKMSEKAQSNSNDLRLQPLPPSGGEEAVVCPFCGLKIRKSEVASTYEYNGKTYYFCTEDHMEAFKRNPETYLNIDTDDNN